MAGKILVVEDDPEARELLVLLLGSGNYDVLVAGDGLEALGGPDGKTTKRLLQGLGSSRDDVYHKLIESLNEANRRARRNVVLTIHDIPQD